MKTPPPPDIIQHLIDSGITTKEEYEKEFIDEWNRIFPNGIQDSINKMYTLMKNSGHLEKWQSVIQRSLNILEGKNDI